MTDQFHDYKFGPLSFRVNGLGLYFGGKHLNDACDKLTKEELKLANREAWRQKKAAERAMARFSNVSTNGNLPFDIASARYEVSDVVCKETWKRMRM